MSEIAVVRQSRGHAVEGGPTTPGARGALDRVVQLFADGPGVPPSAAADMGDWSASLALVCGVAAKVRETHRSARDIEREARRAVQEAEDRARQAEASARDALVRAELADERARGAEERADLASARAVDAQAWLRRIHESLIREFEALAGDEAGSVQDQLSIEMLQRLRFPAEAS